MAKSSFDRAEDALHRSLSQMSQEKRAAEAGAKSAPNPMYERLKIVHEFKRILKRAYHVDHSLYKQLEMTKRQLEALLASYATLAEQEWQSVLALKERAEEISKQAPTPTEASPDKQVQEERHKHIHKRFNVSKRWIPLK